MQELAAMTPRGSQWDDGNEIPERSWVYRFAKKHWFNDFGAYADGLPLHQSSNELAATDKRPAENRDPELYQLN